MAATTPPTLPAGVSSLTGHEPNTHFLASLPPDSLDTVMAKAHYLPNIRGELMRLATTLNKPLNSKDNFLKKVSLIWRDLFFEFRSQNSEVNLLNSEF